MAIKLGVNIDHVATLRQARQEVEPDPLMAARVARQSGADFIVAHLRQDRRHIQDKDLMGLRKMMRSGLHVEMAAAADPIKVMSKVKPDSVCLVPESRDEVTTQGGLKLKGARATEVEKAIKKLKKLGCEVSLFVDPDAISVRMAHKIGADTVELCTDAYAGASGKHRQRTELERLELAAYLAHELKLDIHAGHGLDYTNVALVAQIPNIRCVSVGYAIVARSVFTGFKQAVAEMKKIVVSSR